MGKNYGYSNNKFGSTYGSRGAKRVRKAKPDTAKKPDSPLKRNLKMIAFYGGLLIIAIVVTTISLKMNYDMGDYCSKFEVVDTVDLVNIIDENPGKTLLIEFDIRSDKPGKICVESGISREDKYTFCKEVQATDEFTHFVLEADPVLKDETLDTCLLRFEAELESGIIPAVKNLIINIKE